MYWIKVENVFCNIKKYQKRVLPGSFYVNGHNLGFIHTLQSENCLIHHDKQHPRIVPLSTIFLVNGHTKAFHFRFRARTTLQRTINSKSITLTIAFVFHPLKSWLTDSKLRTVFFSLNKYYPSLLLLELLSTGPKQKCCLEKIIYLFIFEWRWIFFYWNNRNLDFLLCVDLQCFGSGSALWQRHCFGVFGKTFYNITKVKRALWLVKYPFTNVKKAIGLMSKTKSLHVHHAFLYISLPSLHNYDVKWPNFKFTWELERQANKFYHLCLNLGVFPSLHLQPKFPSQFFLSNWATWGIAKKKKRRDAKSIFQERFHGRLRCRIVRSLNVRCFTVERSNVGTML